MFPTKRVLPFAFFKHYYWMKQITRVSNLRHKFYFLTLSLLFFFCFTFSRAWPDKERAKEAASKSTQHTKKKAPWSCQSKSHIKSSKEGNKNNKKFSQCLWFMLCIFLWLHSTAHSGAPIQSRLTDEGKKSFTQTQNVKLNWKKSKTPAAHRVDG